MSDETDNFLAEPKAVRTGIKATLVDASTRDYKAEMQLDVNQVTNGKQKAEFDTNLFHWAISVSMAFYVMYVLVGIISWISHLGARIPVLAKFLPGSGYASNPPVADVKEFILVNFFHALVFAAPHTFLRPPVIQKFVGFRYARLVYCFIAALSLHYILVVARPINMKTFYTAPEDYIYNETENVPLFTLPWPKYAHDFLSVWMIVYSVFCTLIHKDTYVILGFNRACFGPKSGTDKFPPGLTPRMDIVTWLGYCVWLRMGGLGFLLFSGLSILPFKVYTWDIVSRIAAAAYLRLRSRGFRIWLGKIETTHHIIWVLRGAIAIFALSQQYYLLTKEDGKFSGELLTPKYFAMSIGSMIALAIFLDRLEKLR